MAEDLASQIGGISALAEPVRRALYLYVVAQPYSVSRDQAAEGAGLPRHTAKFHLDRLVEEGLLETEYRRLSGRRGPGAGRPSKLYRRSDRQVTVSLPERHYDLAGQILAQAIEEAARAGIPVQEAVEQAAVQAGRSLGMQTDQGQPSPDQPAETLESVAGRLSEQGYEPRLLQNKVVLVNCPFHALAKRHTELVCGMNLDLITAMLDALGATNVDAKLDPAPGRCCVTLTQPASSQHDC